jgi:peptidoglycan-associated lipoprotein
MNAHSMLKKGIIAASLILLVGCSKHTANTTMGGADDGSMQANGLGQSGGFAGQETGESYTTQAPHNQIYLFSYDGSDLAPKYIPSINAQAEYLKAHTGARIMIAGHTDERGSREYNVALGERRANTVAEIMRMSGVSQQQMRVVSYGKERPVYFGHDEASHRQNRRVELTFEATR